MKIWVINQTATPPSLGGLVRHYYFSKNFALNDHSVRIITSSKIHNADINMIKDSSLYVEKEVDGIEYTFVKTCNYYSNGFKRIYSMLQFALNAIRVCYVLKKGGEIPDIIYTSSPSPIAAFTGTLFAKKNGIKSVVEIRDLWPKSIVDYNGMSEKNIIIRILYRLEKWLYKNADAVIFTIAGGKDYIKDMCWADAIDLNKIYYLNNGVDLEEFDQNRDKYKLSDEDLDNNNIFKVVYAGSIRKANNIESIVEAAKLCRERGKKDIKFIIYGEGTYKDSLKKACLSQGLDNIVFKGRIDKKYVPYVLSKCNLTLLNYIPASTWKYGSSQNKLFEYMAAGRPILSTIKIGYSLIEKYNCGIEIETQTPEAIAEKVIELSELDLSTYEKLCSNSRKAAEDFDFKRLSDELIDILKSV